MKYVLVDKLTGNYVQSSGGSRIDLTPDLYEAALFRRSENADNALKKIVDKNGNFKILGWRLLDPQQPGYWTEKELSDQTLDLEIRSVTFTLN